jgi:uncharacterized glyoxalase superfamily protein PhnB
MAYQRPQDGGCGEQDWRQRYADNSDTGGHLWSSGIHEDAEGPQQMDAVQMSSATYSSSWNRTYHAPTNDVAYGYNSMPTQRNGYYHPAVLDSYLQANTNSSIATPFYPETTGMPSAQYYHQGQHSSEELGDFSQYVSSNLTQRESKMLMLA